MVVFRFGGNFYKLQNFDLASLFWTVVIKKKRGATEDPTQVKVVWTTDIDLRPQIASIFDWNLSVLDRA